MNKGKRFDSNKYKVIKEVKMSKCGDWGFKKCYWLEWYTPDGSQPLHVCHLRHFWPYYSPPRYNCECFIENNNDSYNKNLNKLKEYKNIVCYYCGRKYPDTIIDIYWYTSHIKIGKKNNNRFIRCINRANCKKTVKQLKKQNKNNKLKLKLENAEKLKIQDGHLSIINNKTDEGSLSLSE